MLLQILIISAIIERFWEYIQLAIGKQYLSPRVKTIGAVLLAMTAAITLRLDFLYALDVTGTPSIPGFIVTGFVLAMGANTIHDLAGAIKGIREEKRK